MSFWACLIKIFTVDLILYSKCQIDTEYLVSLCGLLRKHELYVNRHFSAASKMYRNFCFTHYGLKRLPSKEEHFCRIAELFLTAGRPKTSPNFKFCFVKNSSPCELCTISLPLTHNLPSLRTYQRPAFFFLFSLANLVIIPWHAKTIMMFGDDCAQG